LEKTFGHKLILTFKMKCEFKTDKNPNSFSMYGAKQKVEIPQDRKKKNCDVKFEGLKLQL